MTALQTFEAKVEAVAKELEVDIEVVWAKVHAEIDVLLGRAKTDAETVKAEVTAAADKVEDKVEKADASLKKDEQDTNAGNESAGAATTANTSPTVTVSADAEKAGG